MFCAFPSFVLRLLRLDSFQSFLTDSDVNCCEQTYKLGYTVLTWCSEHRGVVDAYAASPGAMDRREEDVFRPGVWGGMLAKSSVRVVTELEWKSWQR